MKITRCGICKEKGHWHRECPNKDDPKFKKRGLAAHTFDGVASDPAGSRAVPPETLQDWKEVG
eukprot:7824548-Pyramimonas_sp.AAC.1